MIDGRIQESRECLSTEAQQRHHGLVSSIEELDAVDGYGQRTETTPDRELENGLVHERDEDAG